MGFGDLLGPGLDGYLISDSLARMNDFPVLNFLMIFIRESCLVEVFWVSILC